MKYTELTRSHNVSSSQGGGYIQWDDKCSLEQGGVIFQPLLGVMAQIREEGLLQRGGINTAFTAEKIKLECFRRRFELFAMIHLEAVFAGKWEAEKSHRKE